jgi:hypothetical protein
LEFGGVWFAEEARDVLREIGFYKKIYTVNGDRITV